MNTNKQLAVFLWKGKKAVTYLPWLCLPPIALLAALFFTYMQQSRSPWEALQNERFLIAAAWSFLPALIIAFYIQGLSYVLDLKFHRRGYQSARIKKQFCYGVLIPCLFLATYYSIYYAAYGKNIFKRKYFQIEFPMATSVITGLNMGYMLWYLYRIERRRSAKRNRLTLLDANRAKRQGYHNEITVNNGRRKTVVVTKDIICIIRWDKVGVILLKTGKVVQIDNTLNEMLAMLDLRFFAKSNRWCIINLRQVALTVYENENFSEIRYKPTALKVLQYLESDVDKTLEKEGRSEFLTMDKYRLNRNFRKSFEAKLYALRKTPMSS
jgi:hypothetical protein